MMNLRVSSDVIDQLDATAEAEGTTRKVMVTRALAAAGYRVAAHDREDRSPEKLRRRAA
jgi:predicted transcriptional regulator